MHTSQTQQVALISYMSSAYILYYGAKYCTTIYFFFVKRIFSITHISDIIYKYNTEYLKTGKMSMNHVYKYRKSNKYDIGSI